MTAKAFSLLIVCLLQVAVRHAYSRLHATTLTTRDNSAALVRELQQGQLSLVSGDLPTDSGWARPITADTAKYSLLSTSPTTPLANHWLHLQVKCDGCQAFAKPLFFARMYGPSVLSGHVTSTQDGLYDVAFLPLDAGDYQLEIVLEFSSTPEFVDYPNVTRTPGYEGHLIPGFPLQVTVQEDPSSPAPSAQQPLCAANDLLLQNFDLVDGLSKGRWQVTDKQQSTPPSITMKYQPKQDCALVSLTEGSSQQLIDQCASTASATSSIQLILIGDSVMGLQYRRLLDTFVLPAGLQVDYIYTGGGLEVTYTNVTSLLTKLANDNPNSERIVVFNSGIHDILVLFNQMVFKRKNPNEALADPAGYYRTFRYRHTMEQFATFLSTYSASAVMFQTTTAAWPKWGNGGLHWPGHKEQPHLLSTHAVEQYNRIALHTFSTLSVDIKVLDGYWITLSRPDCREKNTGKGRSAKMGHPGQEVVAAMLQTILTVVVSQSKCIEN